MINKDGLKLLLFLSLFSTPISYFLFRFINSLLSSIVGIPVGDYTITTGFPIPYYRDYTATPGVEFNQPLIQIVNFLLYYVVVTCMVYFIYLIFKPAKKLVK